MKVCFKVDTLGWIKEALYLSLCVCLSLSQHVKQLAVVKKENQDENWGEQNTRKAERIGKEKKIKMGPVKNENEEERKKKKKEGATRWPTTLWREFGETAI